MKVLLLVSLPSAAGLLHADEEQTEHSQGVTDTEQARILTESDHSQLRIDPKLLPTCGVQDGCSNICTFRHV